jgi:hypothetical protein
VPRPPPSGVASQLPPESAKSPAGFASLIVADFPALLAEFREKRFTLLWRGSRAGFGAGDFHCRCDGRAHTLTLIQDTDGNIFGGFTPVAWESPVEWKRKADPSLKSFLLKENDHVSPERHISFQIRSRAMAD